MTESNLQTPTQPQPPSRRNWGDLLLHRWPTALGIAVALLTIFDLEIDRAFVSLLSAIIVLMALVYLGAAVLGRRSSAWLVFLAGFVVIVVLRLLDLSSVATIILLVSALVFLALGVARGQWRNADSFPLQAVGMIGFGAIALVTLYIEPRWAGYLIAAALLAHAVWDVVHLRRNRVVAASYAEACCVLDTVVGVALLVALLR